MELLKVVDYINWWEINKETGLDDLSENFLRIFSNVDFLPPIYFPILYKYLNNNQIKHWRNDVFSFSKDKIEEIDETLGKDVMKITVISNFHYLIYAYESLLDIEERIALMNRFKGSEELKAKIFSINIYNDLLNNAFSNVLKLFIEFQSVIEEKNLFQKNLTPQIECLTKRGFSKVTELADSNIRNAISHGGVKVNGAKMVFSYREGEKYLNQKYSVYQFKDLLLQLFDGLSAIVLSWINYLCEENIDYEEIRKNTDVHVDTSLFFEKLSVSTLKTSCNNIEEVSVNNGSEKRQQVNIDFGGVDLDIDSRIFLGLYSAKIIFRDRKLCLNDTIMVSFNTPKVASSFFVVKGAVLHDFERGAIDLKKAWQYIIEDGSQLMFPVNDEVRNEFEDLFRFYPDIENENYHVTEIEDISVDDKKRFKAIAYLKRATRPNHVKTAVKDIVDQLKFLENYGFSANKVKHGTMEADILYIVLYKNELRRGEDRNLHPSNDNFIAQVQYDAKSEFPIRINLIDSYLKLRREGKIEYNWNPNF